MCGSNLVARRPSRNGCVSVIYSVMCNVLANKYSCSVAIIRYSLSLYSDCADVMIFRIVWPLSW